MKVYLVIDVRLPFDKNINVFKNKEDAEIFCNETFIKEDDYEILERGVLE